MESIGSLVRKSYFNFNEKVASSILNDNSNGSNKTLAIPVKILSSLLSKI